MTTTEEQVVELTTSTASDSPVLAPEAASPAQADTGAGPVVDSSSDPAIRRAARAVWQHSAVAGRPLTGAQLGEQFNQPLDWGWDRIAEVVLAEEDPRGFARDLWRASSAVGQPLSGRELGELCGRSERWGRACIGEARQADANAAAATTPARRSGTDNPTTGTPGPADGSTEPQTAEQSTDDSATPDAIAIAVDQVAHAAPSRPDESTANTAETAEAAATPSARPVPVPGGARLVAWAGFLFGTAISVAANVLYAWLPTLAGKAGPPGLAPQVGAAVWPIALVISVEVLSRVAWRPGWAWQLARYGGAGVVALGAAVISYGHLSGVLNHWGYGTTGAAVGPLVVDGLMTISGFALLAMSHSGTTSGTNGTPSGTASGTASGTEAGR